MTSLLIYALVAQGPIPGALVRLPHSALTEGFSHYFDYNYARDGVRHNIEAHISEDGSSVWVYSVGGHTFSASPGGWHQFSLPLGLTPGREQFHFAYLPSSKSVVAYTLSQSKQVQETISKERLLTPASERVKWRLTRDTSTILAVLDKTRLITATEGAVWDPVGEGAKTLMACALINLTERGSKPNRTAFLPHPVAIVGRTIGASFENRVIKFVQVGGGPASMFSYDTGANRLRRLAKESSTIPISAEPQLYDFVKRRVFYDFSTVADKKARIWREYSLGKRRWMRFSPPKGDPTSVFYSQGKLYAGSRVGKATEHLYVAGDNRTAWQDLGPYVVHARSLSGRWWLMQRSTDHKFFLLDTHKSKL